MTNPRKSLRCAFCNVLLRDAPSGEPVCPACRDKGRTLAEPARQTTAPQRTDDYYDEFDQGLLEEQHQGFPRPSRFVIVLTVVLLLAGALAGFAATERA